MECWHGLRWNCDRFARNGFNVWCTCGCEEAAVHEGASCQSRTHIHDDNLTKTRASLQGFSPRPFHPRILSLSTRSHRPRVKYVVYFVLLVVGASACSPCHHCIFVFVFFLRQVFHTLFPHLSPCSIHMSFGKRVRACMYAREIHVNEAHRCGQHKYCVNCRPATTIPGRLVRGMHTSCQRVLGCPALVDERAYCSFSFSPGAGGGVS